MQKFHKLEKTAIQNLKYVVQKEAKSNIGGIEYSEKCSH